MDETANLRLPYIMAAQAQKHVTHNEAIRVLDALVHLAVLDRDLASPPAVLADGDRYIVASGASGAWAGWDYGIAAYQDGAWMRYVPREGFIAWIDDENAAVVWDGSAWITLSSGGSASVNPTPLVGVNATADTTNRLKVASPATLFDHPGSGGHQVKINKATASDTASLLYQTAYSGRVEMGTAGDDNFHIKVSPDGSSWLEALIVDKATGAVSFPHTTLGTGGGGGVGPNLLVNGGFQINQRAFGGGALTAGSYGFDRWKAATGGANVSLSGFVVTLASGELAQVVELALWGSASFASQQVTVSVEAPSANLTVTFGSQTGTITAGSGRRSVTLTLAVGDTGNLTFKIKAAAAGSVTFSRLKLELGASATAWEARPLAVETLLAKRYFAKIPFAVDTTSTYAEAIGVNFPATMRAVPTVTREDDLRTNMSGTYPRNDTVATVDGLAWQSVPASGGVRRYWFGRIVVDAEL